MEKPTGLITKPSSVTNCNGITESFCRNVEYNIIHELFLFILSKF